MKKLLVVVAVAMIVMGVVETTPWSDRSVVVVYGEDGGHGSGVVVAPTKVITAKHVAQMPGLTIDGQPVVRTVMDPDSDVALLEVERPLERPVARLSDRPMSPGDSVMVVGAVFDLPVARFTGRVILVNVPAGLWPVAMITDCHAGAGCSGGAVVFKGRVVGIHVGSRDLLRVEVPVREFDLE